MKFQNSSDISWFRNFIQHRDTWELLSPVITPKLMGDLVTGPIWKQVLVLCNMTWGLLRWNVVLFESRTFLSSAYPTIPRAIMITGNWDKKQGCCSFFSFTTKTKSVRFFSCELAHKLLNICGECVFIFIYVIGPFCGFHVSLFCENLRSLSMFLCNLWKTCL